MDLCNYIQNVFEAYLVVTNTLQYNVDYMSNYLFMVANGGQVIPLAIHLPSWIEPLSGGKIPMIERTGSYIRNFEGIRIVDITYDNRVKRKVDVEYL